MKEFIFATKDFFKNFFNWHGRLSRAGYWWARLFVFIVDIILWRLFGMLSELQFLAIPIFGIIILWRLVLFFALLFAAMRRYHDSGKPGWLALIFDGFGRLCFMGGMVWLVFVIIIVALGGPFAAANEAFGHLIGSGLLVCIMGGILCFVNFLFLIRSSDLSENAYGEPRKFEAVQDTSHLPGR